MISTIRNRSVRRRAALRLLSAAFWLCLWQWAYFAVGQEILVASPGDVLCRLARLARTGSFWLTVLFSMGRIVEGFLIGVLLGAGLAVLTESSSVLDALFRPALVVMRATPVASFIILALVWIRAAHVPVFACVVIVLPLVWANVSEGIRKTDPNLLGMARMYGFGASGTARRVYVPSILPYFTAACTTGMGMAWKGGVAAEVLSSLPLSLGGEIYLSKIYLETGDLFAWTAVVVLMSVLLERAMIRVVKAAGKRFGFGGEGESHGA